jgi:hypothetical protein
MRTSESVQIVATEQVKKLAQKAMDIQSASNPRAVANLLSETMSHFCDTGNGQKTWGSDLALQNPVSLAFLNKLNDLAGCEQSKTDCFCHCMDLTEGKNVNCDVAFLS